MSRLPGWQEAPELEKEDSKAGLPLMRTDLLSMAAIALVGLLVFLPGLRASLASEDFDFYRAARNTDLQQALKAFIPTNHYWYRPFNDLGFWIEVHLFGLNPTAFHVVSLTGHVISAALLYRLARTLGSGPLAALVAGLVFVTTVHAHEVVWWWADLHYAFAGPLIVGSLVAWFSQRKAVAVVLAVAALMTDESAVLLLPVVMVGEFLTRGGSTTWSHRLLGAVPAAIPLMILVALYFAFRIGVGDGIWGESVPCRSPSCVAAGVVNYAARLVVRPDRAYGIFESYKLMLTVLGAVAGAAVGVVMAMRWRERRVISFGVAWTALTVVFFVLALWPYASDRFMYYPDMGVALAVGGCAQEAIHLLASGNRTVRFVAPIAGLAVVLWVGAGIHMLEARAGGWVRAGNEAASIVTNVYAQVPNPPHDVLLQIDDVPDSSQPVFPPGNTGPYLFRNGLESAIRLKFGRDDIWVAWTGHAAEGVHANVIHLRVNRDDSVTVAGGL